MLIKLNLKTINEKWCKMIEWAPKTIYTLVHINKIEKFVHKYLIIVCHVKSKL